jgi:hypothetical protein
MLLLQNHKSHNRQFTFVIFVTFVEQTEGRQACRLSAQRWEERVGGFTVVGESLSGQIKALGMVAWFSKSAVADRFRSADPLRLE